VTARKVVDGVLKQVGIVRDAIGDQIPVRGVLCFVEADWPLFGGRFTTRVVDVMRPKRPYPLVRAGGPEGVETLGDAH